MNISKQSFTMRLGQLIPNRNVVIWTVRSWCPVVSTMIDCATTTTTIATTTIATTTIATTTIATTTIRLQW